MTITYWGLKDGCYYSHIYRHKNSVKMCTDGAGEIVELYVIEHTDQTMPTSEEAKLFGEADYWGFKNEGEDHFEMIRPSVILLKMCFPYGLKAAEEKGDGKAYRLLVFEKLP